MKIHITRADDRHLRDFRRMNGLVQIFHDRPIPGPYRQTAREQWLRRVLEAQSWIRKHGPAHVRDMELISFDELNEIRRIWVVEKHEIEDLLPRIYAEVTGTTFPGGAIDDNLPLTAEDMAVLQKVCSGDPLLYELSRELLDIERRYRASARRAGLFEELEDALGRSSYADERDATDRALRERDARDAAQSGNYEQLSLIPPVSESETVPKV